MAVRMKCNRCGHTYTAHSSLAPCPVSYCKSTTTSRLEEVLDVAADVATAYFMVDVASDVIEGVGSLIGSMFD